MNFSIINFKFNIKTTKEELQQPLKAKQTTGRSCIRILTPGAYIYICVQRLINGKQVHMYMRVALKGLISTFGDQQLALLEDYLEAG